MNKTDKIRKTLNFIAQQRLAVIATSSKNNMPEAAILEFTINRRLEIIFDALPNFRKCRNLKENPNVAIVFGGEDDRTVQYEGAAQKIMDERKVEKYRKIATKKYPESREIINTKCLSWYKVTPKWIRFVDVGTKPWQQFEINFRKK